MVSLEMFKPHIAKLPAGMFRSQEVTIRDCDWDVVRTSSLSVSQAACQWCECDSLDERQVQDELCGDVDQYSLNSMKKKWEVRSMAVVPTRRPP